MIKKIEETREFIQKKIEEIREFIQKIIHRSPPNKVFFNTIPNPNETNVLLNFSYFDNVQNELYNAFTMADIVVLSGDAGAGKTLTAYTYASSSCRANNSQTHHSFLVGADTVHNLRWNLANLATKEYFNLGITLPIYLGKIADATASDNAIIDDAIVKVQEKLLAERNWLIVFDNMDGFFDKPPKDLSEYEEVKQYFPTTSNGGKILITTRDSATQIAIAGVAGVIDMKHLDPEQGADFLLKRIGFNNLDPQIVPDAEQVIAGAKAAAKRLSSSLGGLLLMLDQAAAYILDQVQSGEVIGQKLLDDYLADYNHRLKGTKLRKYLTKHNLHDSIYETVGMSLDKLNKGKKIDKLAVTVLYISSFFHPDRIPKKFLKVLELNRSSKKFPTDSDLEKAILRAEKLRLLDRYCDDAGERVFYLHREVQEVLQDILSQNTKKKRDAKIKWGLLAAQALEKELSNSGFTIDLLPHAEALIKNDVRPDAKDHETLFKYQILKTAEAGEGWEGLLFASDEPSYEAMHQLDRRDSKFWKEANDRIQTIPNVCSEKFGRVLFSCIYFVIHYWYDLYLRDDSFADSLLDYWSYATEEDTKLIDSLRAFQESYPPVREYDTRVAQKKSWSKVEQTLRSIREQLGIEKSSDKATAAERYVRGITNFYISEALRYGENSNFKEALKLNKEAEKLFEENNDDFHRIWAECELANVYLELGQCHSKAGQARKAKRYFALAKAKCNKGLEDTIEQASDDAIDLEVVANFYRVIADTIWEASGDSAQVAGYRCAACYMGYAFVLSEPDKYTLAFYGEQVERLMAVFKLEPAKADSLGKYIQEFWKSSPPANNTITLSFQDLEKLRESLCPLEPELDYTDADNAKLKENDEKKMDEFIEARLTEVGSLNKDYPIPETFVTVATIWQQQHQKKKLSTTDAQ